jgi:putative proteasome-type protease
MGTSGVIAGRDTDTTMTYCVGILVAEGLTMIADTRTNAGLDNVAQFRKLSVFERPGDRIMALATAGNLAISQSVVSLLVEGVRDPETGTLETIWTQPSMFRAAQFVGRCIREVHKIDGPALEQTATGFDVTMMLGGQVSKGRLRLFMIYRQGNFIEATEDTPFLQIGEHKYGKPILDRAIKFGTSLEEALKIGLISMDSTMRSNLGVGMPIDLVTVRRDAIAHDVMHRIEPGEPYFHDLRERWSAALRAAHQAIPKPPYRG